MAVYDKLTTRQSPLANFHVGGMLQFSGSVNLCRLCLVTCRFTSEFSLSDSKNTARAFENPLEQFFGGFGVGVLFAPGLGELAGDGGGEDGLAVALELGFGVAQGGDAGVEPRKEFLNPSHDAALFGEGWD